MTGCRDAEAPYCQCAACAGSCCCRAEHLHLPCPVADCPDYVPRGRDDFVPVLTSKQLAERQAALCLTPWDWPLTLAGAVLAGAACVVECALTDRYTRP